MLESRLLLAFSVQKKEFFSDVFLCVLKKFVFLIKGFYISFRMVSFQNCLKLLQDRSSLEGLKDGLLGLQLSISNEASALKSVEVRDAVTGALCRLAQDEV